MGQDRPAGWQGFHFVTMAHPDLSRCRRRETGEQVGRIVNSQLGRTELAPVGLGHLPPGQVVQNPHAIADAQKRNRQTEDGGGERRGVGVVHAGRPTRQDNAFWIHGLNTVYGNIVRMDLAVDVRLANAASNQLRILTTEVENKNHNCQSQLFGREAYHYLNGVSDSVHTQFTHYSKR